MPKIAQYDAPDLGLRPNETGINALAGAARRIEGDYSQAAASRSAIGQMVSQDIQTVGKVATDYISHQEISRGAPAFANFMDAKTKQWDATPKDINDPTTAIRFLEKDLEPDLAKFRDSFLTEAGQKWAETRVDAFRNHMFTKTSADMATLAGQAATVNYRQTVNGLSNTVRSDPTSMDFSLQTLDDSIAAVIASNPYLKGAAAGKLQSELTQKGREEIIKAAALGAIEKTGEVPSWVTDAKYSPYINGAELKQLAQAAKVQQSTMRLQERQARIYDNQIKQDASKAAISKVFTDSVTFDANGKVTIRPDYFQKMLDIEKRLPGVATDHVKTYLTWAQTQQREKRELIIDNPVVKNRLLDGLFDTVSPTTDVDILTAANRSELSQQTTSSMLALHKALEEKPLKGPIYQATMTAVKGILGSGDKGIENYGMFLQNFLPQYLKQSKDGSLQPNALDLKDPNSLISQTLKPWRLSPQEKLTDRLNKNLGGMITPDANLFAPAGTDKPPPSPPGAPAAVVAPPGVLAQPDGWEGDRDGWRWIKRGNWVVPLRKL